MNLSTRELDVIRLLVAGRTNRQIAAELKISTTAVIDDIARIYRKLGAHDRASAIAAWNSLVAAGLAPAEPETGQ